MTVPADASTPTLAAEAAAFALTLIQTRQTVLPKRLLDPGPDEAQLRQLLEAAAAAPDHELRRPWRFIGVPAARRGDLAEVFAAALRDRDPQALPQHLEMAREKAHRAPLLMLAVARLDASDREVPAPERWISLGCAIQNLLLAAHAMGYGTALTSGQAIASPRLHALFALGAGEAPVCFVNVGSASASKPMRPRPEAGELFCWL